MGYGDGAQPLGLAHLVLSGCSLLALKYAPASAAVSFGTFGNIFLYGIAGFLRYAIPAMHNSVRMIKFFAITHMLTRSLALPCVVTYLYLITGFSSDIAYAHLLSGLVPVVLFIMKLSVAPLTDLILAANIVSLLYISYTFGNVWGIGLGACHLLNHFFLNQIRDCLSAPTECLFVIELMVGDPD